MKKAQRIRIHAAALTAGAAAGTLLWEIFERIFAYAGYTMDFSAGPVGFDIAVLAIYINLNPGTAAGSLLTWIALKKAK